MQLLSAFCCTRPTPPRAGTCRNGALTLTSTFTGSAIVTWAALAAAAKTSTFANVPAVAAVALKVTATDAPAASSSGSTQLIWLSLTRVQGASTVAAITSSAGRVSVISTPVAALVGSVFVTCLGGLWARWAGVAWGGGRGVWPAPFGVLRWGELF